MNDPYDEFHIRHPLYRKGVQQERERIIELLKGEDIYERPVVLDRDRLIALIQVNS